MERREIEFSTRLTREDVAGVIEALIEGLKDGKLQIKKSNEALELEVPRVVDLEVEASIDEERAEFEIEVSWRTNRAENPDLPLPNGDTDKGATEKNTSAVGENGKKAPAKSNASPKGTQKSTTKPAAKEKIPSSKSASGAKAKKPAGKAATSSTKSSLKKE